MPLYHANTFSERYYRFQWSVNDEALKEPEGPKPFQGFARHPVQADLIWPCVIKNRNIAQNGTREILGTPPGRCIYCNCAVYSSTLDQRLGDEHVIAEGMGGTLVLEQASCENCEKATKRTEQIVLRGTLWAPRHHLKTRMKKRTRDNLVPCRFEVDGHELDVLLPIEDHPVLLLLAQLKPPGVLIGRPKHLSGIGGLWQKGLNYKPKELFLAGRKKGYSVEFDSLRFAQMLAKIAHAYIAAEIGIGKFQPTLSGFIRSNPAKQENDLSIYRLIGGSPTLETPSSHLHEIGWFPMGADSQLYLIVRLRLFALLGTPTYYIVPGYVTDSNLFVQLTRRA